MQWLNRATLRSEHHWIRSWPKTKKQCKFSQVEQKKHMSRIGKETSVSAGQSKMWKDVFLSPLAKSCCSACIFTALAQLTKSIRLHVCGRVVRSLWVCGGRRLECVQVTELLPWRDEPIHPHQLLRQQDKQSTEEKMVCVCGAGVTGQETWTQKGFGCSVPQTLTHMFIQWCKVRVKMACAVWLSLCLWISSLICTFVLYPNNWIRLFFHYI